MDLPLCVRAFIMLLYHANAADHLPPLSPTLSLSHLENQQIRLQILRAAKNEAMPLSIAHLHCTPPLQVGTIKQKLIQDEEVVTIKQVI
jgi:hypothetical protein